MQLIYLHLYLVFHYFSRMEGNPWVVESIMDFNFFCCPECQYQGKTAKSFEFHAIETHPMSKKFFDHKELEIDTETNNFDQEEFKLDIPNESDIEIDHLAQKQDENKAIETGIILLNLDLKKHFDVI